MKYEYLEQTIKDILHDGIENKKYMLKMSRLEPVPMLGICIKSSNAEEHWVSCHIDEERYKLEDGYKITLKADNPIYGYEHYYQEDFISLLKRGIIVDVTGKDTKIEQRVKVINLGGKAISVIPYETLIVSEEYE